MTDTPESTPEPAVGSRAWIDNEARKAVEAAQESEVVEAQETPAEAEVDERPSAPEAMPEETPAEAQVESTARSKYKYRFGGRDVEVEPDEKEITDALLAKHILGQKTREWTEQKRAWDEERAELEKLRAVKEQADPIIQALSKADADLREQVYDALGVNADTKVDPLKAYIDERLAPVERADRARQIREAQVQAQRNLAATKEAFGDGPLSQADIENVEYIAKTLGFTDDQIRHPYLASILYAADRASQNPALLKMGADDVINAADKAAEGVKQKVKAESKLPPPGSPAKSNKAPLDLSEVPPEKVKEAVLEAEWKKGNIPEEVYRHMTGKR